MLAALSVDAATACEEQVLVICVNGGSLGSADVAIRLMPKRNEPTQTRRASPARPGAGGGKRSTDRNVTGCPLPGGTLPTRPAARVSPGEWCNPGLPRRMNRKERVDG